MADRTEIAERDLRDLAGAIDGPAPSPTLVAAVMERVRAEPVPVRSGVAVVADRLGSRVRGRLRWLAGLLVALLGVGVAVTPVGAEMARWFGIGGAVVRIVPGDSVELTSPEVPGAPGDLRLAVAADRVGFEPAVPAALGVPARVAVLRHGTVVAMSWRDPEAGTVRLDQLEIELAPYWWKAVPDAESVRVGRHDGLWIGVPHDLVLLDASGRETTMPPRLAARTLLWVDGDRTFRLEGDLELERALEIAESVR